MKTKFILAAACSVLMMTSGRAQTVCASDLNGFVASKNIGTTTSYGLFLGAESKAAQTYNYAGPGKITSVRVYGFYAGWWGVPLKIGVYSVDLSGRPLSEIASINQTWSPALNAPFGPGYMEVGFAGGVPVSNRFAITVEIRYAAPFGNTFNLQYTGNGDGGGQDLASLGGPSTGNSWASAKNVPFNKDGDFYLIPTMEHQNVPSFTTTSNCYSVNQSVAFANTTQMTKDSMFNKIARANYTGTNKMWTWNFGDGTAVSNLQHPVHAYTTGGVYITTLTTVIEGWQGICSRTFTRSVSVGLTANAPIVTNALCWGSNTGSVVLGGNLGAPPYQYNLNNGTWQNGQNFTNLVSSVYTVGVKDAKGCIVTTNFNLFQPVQIIFNAVSTTNSTCGNANGSLFTSSSGGVTPLQYSIDGGALKSTPTFTGIAAGMHTLIAVDATGCVSSTLIPLNDISGPAIGSPNITNVSCFGGNDGSITLSSTGGTGSKQYSISGGNTWQASNVFNNVTAGSYNCVVKDNAGCISATNAIINQGQAIALSAVSLPALCNGSNNGQITASSLGGTGFHQYSINGLIYQSGQNFTGLTAGTYTVYAKDVTNCVKTTVVQVTQPTALALALTSASAACNGDANGSIMAVATGGNGSYSYNMNGQTYQGSGTFSNLPAGTYTLTTKDVNNCMAANVITVTEPAAITSTVNTTNSTCTFTNGSIMVLGGGGSGSGYQYSIDGGVTFQNSGLFTPLAAGTRYIMIKDGSNCQITVGATIVDSNGPAIVASTQQNVSCNGGNDGAIAVTTVTGGTGFLQYSKNGINWQISNTFNGLNAGSYVVQVRDANGCTGVVAKTITEPNGFLMTTTTSSISCFGFATGSATIAASGGAGFLAYSINGGVLFQSGSTFNNLPAGTYTLIVKDAANCSGQTLFNIVQPAAIEIRALGILNVTCNGANNGAINIIAAGGTAPYLYSINGTSYFTAGSFNNLPGNNYFVYVKDGNNCISVDNITVLEPAPITIAPILNNVTCSGGNNGAISILVSGGTSPYHYQWSNGALVPTIFNLTSGSYSVQIADFNGCMSAQAYTITQPANPIVINGIITPASAGTSANGSINITINGGVGPYTFNWSNGATTEDISGLNPGTYMVTIIDANGCTSSMTFNVDNLTGISGGQITANMVKLYPNPANDFLTIEANGYRIDKVEVINLLGQTVIENTVNLATAELNVSDLTSGTYFVKVTVNNNSVTKKVNIAK
ncbi:MAG: T9SS type A sorting domain-containing protein [bacterium]|nr:T9SS type A sorting domain-containing protein [bacterium]